MVTSLERLPLGIDGEISDTDYRASYLTLRVFLNGPAQRFFSMIKHKPIWKGLTLNEQTVFSLYSLYEAYLELG